MSGALEMRRDGGVALAINSNPGKRNALSFAFYDAFGGLLEGAGRAGIGAVVLTGADGFFSAGGDLGGLAERATRDEAGRREGVDRLNAVIRAIRACETPVIAAVEGGAAGAGVSLAFACDLVVAARGAYFSLSHVKIGLTPDGGATHFLGQSLPRQLAGELMMTGDRIGAERLAELGVINRLTAAGEAVDEALALARRLADGPAGALASIKALLAAAPGNSLEAQLEAEARSVGAALGGAEGREGIAAFREKRAPDFAGLRRRGD